MSNPIASPAFTGPAGFAVLVMWIEGQFTVMLTGPTELLVPGVSFVAEALAEFATVPQVAAVVGEVMCTWTSAPGVRVVEARTRWPEPLIVQEPVVFPGSIAQLRPEL